MSFTSRSVLGSRARVLGSGRSRALVAAVSTLVFGGEASAAAIVLNEVLYDPEGTDSDFEFVEIAAPSGADSSASLDGWILETGNGARPGEWTVAWRGGSADRLRGGLFVIGEQQVEPAPDAIANLDLQNGPDACRLRGPSGEIDLVGWGEPLDPSMSESRPAPDPPSGTAIVRLPDGRDTNCNECDWRPASPSPAEFNAPAVGVFVASANLPPPDLPAGTPWEFGWEIVNVGRSSWSGVIRIGCAVHPEETLATLTPFAEKALSPGETATVREAIAPPPGAHVPLGDPSFPTNAGPWLGNGEDLAFTEIFARPSDEEPEWIEILCVGQAAVDLASFHFEDEAGSRATFAGILQPGEIAILASDSTGFRSRWNVPASIRIVSSSSWPSLNHTASQENVADRVRCVLGDRVAASAAWSGGIEENISWERVSLQVDANEPEHWQPSLDPTGATPGRPNSRDGDRILPERPRTGSLHVFPRSFAPGRDAPALLVFQSRKAAQSCEMSVFDSSGILVRRLDPWSVDGTEHRAMWDGRNGEGMVLPLGLYVVRGLVPDEPPARDTIVLLQ